MLTLVGPCRYQNQPFPFFISDPRPPVPRDAEVIEVSRLYSVVVFVMGCVEMPENLRIKEIVRKQGYQDRERNYDGWTFTKTCSHM